MLGFLDLLMSAGKMAVAEHLALTDVNMQAEWWAQLLKQSQDIPHRGPGPARAPSFKYQAWQMRPAQSTQVEIADTGMFRTKKRTTIAQEGHPAECPALR